MSIKNGSGADSSEDISMDNILNTGENSNRETTETTETVDADGNKLDVNGNIITDDTETTTETEDNNEENENNLRGLFSSFVSEEGLSEDDKQIRIDLLAEHKGNTFDEQGNILDAEGNVLKSFEDLYTEQSTQDSLSLDDKGNEINDKGEIVRTAVEVAVDTTVVNKWHADSEYEFLNEDGTTKIYEDTDEGRQEFVKDSATQQFVDFKEEFFSQNKELTEVAKHLLSGGTLDNFQKDADYSNIDTATLSKEAKLDIIKQSYLASGLEEDRVKGLLTMFSDANLIDVELAKALPALDANNAKIKADRDKRYNDSIAARNEKIDKHWADVNTIITKGDLGAITVPDADKAAFYEYVSKAIDTKGNSKDRIDRSKDTKEQTLMLSYLRFKGFDLNKLVDTKVRSARVKTLKQRIAESSKQKPTTVNESRQSQRQGASGEDITIGNLLGK